MLTLREKRCDCHLNFLRDKMKNGKPYTYIAQPRNKERSNQNHNNRLKRLAVVMRETDTQTKC